MHLARGFSRVVRQQRRQMQRVSQRGHAAAAASETPAKPAFRMPSKLRMPLDNTKSSIKLRLHDKLGSLQTALGVFADHKINLTRLESRPSKRSTDYEFYIDFTGAMGDSNVQSAMNALRSNDFTVSELESRKVPWFPRRIRDLDAVANDVLDAGEDLEADHPGFSDPTYRERRSHLVRVAETYKQGTPIPKIDYSEDETKTWGMVYDKLTPLLEAHACKEHVRMLPLLVENCGYARDNIPQLQDISEFLKECTGVTLRPVAGLLSARNFLYGLAFRVFFSTQYIRHHSKPLYTPEPDICHELLGHAPLFADQDFADFSQEIGLASIGATDEQVLQLARCYWFTVEFGLTYENGERKAFGAGLLSSFGELEYAMSDKPEIRPFDPLAAAQQDYPITEYQPVYYAASSFEEAKTQMTEFSSSFQKPFNIRYNPYTQCLDVDSNVSHE